MPVGSLTYPVGLQELVVLQYVHNAGGAVYVQCYEVDLCRGVALDVAAFYRFRPALLVNAIGVAVSSIWMAWFPVVLKLYRFACYAHVRFFGFPPQKFGRCCGGFLSFL